MRHGCSGGAGDVFEPIAHPPRDLLREQRRPVVVSDAHVAFTRHKVFVDGEPREPTGQVRDIEAPWDTIARKLGEKDLAGE